MKKILIISSGIHEQHGTGITLMNLFNKIPQDNICIITNKKNAVLTYQKGYKNVFILGKGYEDIRKNKEIIKFSRLETRSLTNAYEDKRNSINRIKGFLKAIKRYLIDKGIYYQRSRNRLNPAVKKWLTEQSPTSIYSVGIYIPLTLQIKKYLDIPMVLHIMDDWIATEIKPGLLSFLWKHLIEKDLRRLMQASKELIAISDKMAIEYQKRYGYEWHVFHNPLVVDNWLPYQKTNYDIQSSFKIAFLGRKTSANSEIINTLSEILTNFNTGIPIEFHIYTQVKEKSTDVIFYHDFVPHDELPKIMQTYDLLVLPFFFDSYWTKYARLSMPTKLSEFLITGVPVYVISPQDTAIYEFCTENKCAFISEKIDATEIKKQITAIIKNKMLREKIASTGKSIALERFNADVVSEKFRKLFNNH